MCVGEMHSQQKERQVTVVAHRTGMAAGLVPRQPGQACPAGSGKKAELWSRNQKFGGSGAIQMIMLQCGKYNEIGGMDEE